MKRLIALLASLALAVLGCAAAFAEAPDTATPTDLEPAEPVCAHEHTSVINYFSNPIYTRVNNQLHRVSGAATEVVVCKDCGETLSVTELTEAVEYRNHTFKKGVCALCGAAEPAREAESAGESAPAVTSTPEPETAPGWDTFDETLTNVTEFGNIFLFGCAGSARCCR